MGIFWTESHDASDSNSYGIKKTINGTGYNSVPNLVTSGPRTGGGCNSSEFTLLIGGADRDTTITFGIALRYNTTTAESIMASFSGDIGATKHLDITFKTSDNKFRVYRGSFGSGGVLIGTSAAIPTLVTNTYYYLEITATLDDTVGAVKINWDDVTYLNLTGADTKNGGTVALFDFLLVTLPAFGRSDDFYAGNGQGSVNTGMLGPVHILARGPNGNGATSNGVNDAGNSTSNYSHVAGYGSVATTSWGISSYVDFSATGDKDTYAYEHSGTVFPSGNSVPVVMVWTYAEKSDAGARHAKAVARLSGTETQGDDMTLINGSFRAYSQPFEAKPGGGTWTVGDVDSAEFGVIATA